MYIDVLISIRRILIKALKSMSVLNGELEFL